MAEPLGRGLESLIPDREPEEIPADLSVEQNNTVAAPTPVENLPDDAVKTVSPLAGLGMSSRSTYHDNFQPKKTDSIFWIEIDKIEPNPYQPRREFNGSALKDLAMSIREHGLLQPILVSKREIETQTGLDVRYQLIAGERRWRAASLAGLSQIPAVIRRGVPDGRLKLELALIENVQREDLNPMERARAFKQLVDEFHLMQKEIAERIGKSRETVANTLRLLTLPAEIQQGLHEGKITEGHARAVLIAGDDQTKQFEVYNAVLLDRLNVREAENRARQVSGKAFTPRRRPAQTHDPELRQWQNALQERLGTRVRLEKLGERGKIVVEFYSDEELRGILDKLIRVV